MVDPQHASGGRIAFLPMYDFAALHAAHDHLWAAIATRLRASNVESVPNALTRTAALLPVWQDSRLLLGQTCGYPLVTVLRRAVQVMLTPIYDAPGCDGAWHRSAIVVRSSDAADSLEDLRGRRCAVNAWDSNTGMNLLRASVAEIARGDRFFSGVTVTGSHHESLRRVAAGDADIAAIDCVSLAYLMRIDAELTGQTRILDWTPRSPGLPMITSAATDEITLAALRAALAAVFQDPALAETRHTLLLAGFEILPYETYEVIPRLEATAAAQGYARLA